MAGLLAVLCLMVREVPSKTLRVGPNLALKSIAAAVSRASPGDTIIVDAGEYVGNVCLKRPLVLIGIDRPKIAGERDGSAVTVESDSCTVQGFDIRGGGSLLQKEDSGILLKSSYNRITDNVLHDILFGIYLFQCNGSVIRDNRISGRSQLGIGERGTGIHIWNSHRNVIEDNYITVVRDGMYIQESSDNFLRHNVVTNLRYGIHYMYSNSNTFIDNVFYGNVVGGAVMYSRHIRFERNIFAANRGFSSYGLLLQDCDWCVADNNYIVDNSIGLHIEGTNANRITNNYIASNDVAVQVFGSALQDTLIDNNFVGNLTEVQAIGNPRETVFNSEREGNYWDSYHGYDLNDDGVGDFPYKLTDAFAFLEADCANLRLYLTSPAAQAIRVAEDLFPIVRTVKLYDARPLMHPVPVENLGYLMPAPEQRGGLPWVLPALMTLLLVALVIVPAGALMRAKRLALFVRQAGDSLLDHEAGL